MCPAIDKAKQTAATVNGKIEQGKDFIKGKIDDTVDKGIDKVNGVVDPHLDKAVHTFNNSKVGQNVAAANNRAQGIADGLTGFTKSADAKTAGMRNTLGKANDTLNEFNSANKYGDAFGLDAGKIADVIKGFGSKPAEKETKAPEGKAEKKESEQGECGESAKDLIKAAEIVGEVKGGETESAVAEEKPLSQGEELRQNYGHLSPEERKALLAQKIKETKKDNAQNSAYKQVDSLRTAPQKANEFLREALKRQGLRKVPENMKEPQSGQTWIIGDYKYEVRVHPGDSRYTDAKPIFRVARKNLKRNEHMQGTGLEYLGVDNQWYRKADIRNNDALAKLTHIKIRGNEE